MNDPSTKVVQAARINSRTEHELLAHLNRQALIEFLQGPGWKRHGPVLQEPPGAGNRALRCHA